MMAKSIFLRRLLATTQFILGFILGVTLIVGVAAGAGFYYFKMSVSPEKPVFSEETAPTQTEKEEEETKTPPENTEKSTEAKTETVQLEPESELEPEPEPEPKLPPNAYKAQVTWPQGLSLRAEPSVNAGRIGGIAYNSEIIILGETADKTWQRVLIPWSNQEGWVKGGNTKQISY